MFLLTTFALSSFAHSSILEGGCRSSILLQTSTHERGTGKVSEGDLTSWEKLFPRYRITDLDDELSDSAIALSLETCSTVPKSYCDGWVCQWQQFFQQIGCLEDAQSIRLNGSRWITAHAGSAHNI
jgi:hypothetical protein